MSGVAGEDAAPPLSVGDEVKPHGYPTDTFTVVGFRAGGMLVDCARHADGQEFCIPRRQAEGGWLRRQFGSDARAVTSGDAGAHDVSHATVGQASAGSGGVTPGDES